MLVTTGLLGRSVQIWLLRHAKVDTLGEVIVSRSLFGIWMCACF